MIIKGNITPIHENIIVSNMNFDQHVTSGGIVIPGDNGKTEGIYPRWGKVYAIGHEQKDVNVGEWVLVEHGRWTRGIEIEDKNGEVQIIRKIDNDAILLVSDVELDTF